MIDDFFAIALSDAGNSPFSIEFKSILKPGFSKHSPRNPVAKY